MEILLAILVAVIVIGAASNLILLSLKGGQNSGTKNVAISLAKEGLEAIESIRDSSWHNIYLPPSGIAGNPKEDLADYYISKSGSSWVLSDNPADGNISINGITYARKIRIYNVKRQNGGNRDIDETGGIDDPSTQRIKVTVSYPEGRDIVLNEYVTRWKNEVFIQPSWQGGSGVAGPLPASTPATQYNSDDGNILIDSVTGSVKLRP